MPPPPPPLPTPNKTPPQFSISSLDAGPPLPPPRPIRATFPSRKTAGSPHLSSTRGQPSFPSPHVPRHLLRKIRPKVSHRRISSLRNIGDKTDPVPGGRKVSGFFLHPLLFRTAPGRLDKPCLVHILLRSAELRQVLAESSAQLKEAENCPEFKNFTFSPFPTVLPPPRPSPLARLHLSRFPRQDSLGGVATSQPQALQASPAILIGLVSRGGDT